MRTWIIFGVRKNWTIWLLVSLTVLLSMILTRRLSLTLCDLQGLNERSRGSREEDVGQIDQLPLRPLLYRTRQRRTRRRWPRQMKRRRRKKRSSGSKCTRSTTNGVYQRRGEEGRDVSDLRERGSGSWISTLRC